MNTGSWHRTHSAQATASHLALHYHERHKHAPNAGREHRLPPRDRARVGGQEVRTVSALDTAVKIGERATESSRLISRTLAWK